MVSVNIRGQRTGQVVPWKLDLAHLKSGRRRREKYTIEHTIPSEQGVGEIGASMPDQHLEAFWESKESTATPGTLTRPEPISR